ncbi:hypothetical protein [Qipengyuania gelatinilytica]|uniref:Cell wall polymerase n=1 Tax=Qipengyuania gelatinilytica TaxID=2867231 RepID=A0ABX9A2V6_9SPHN|nr:hypothetical protein [Qipengyuania gelatinilytica]QZD95616.1 hypothetical protein K3136_02490 [Qipengyuania gelatinilytica]
MGRLRTRLPALLALSIPVLAGLVFLHLAGAPRHYLAINAGVLVAGLGMALLISAPSTEKARRALTVVMLAGLFLPLLTGPWHDGVARWLPVGPFNLHTSGLLLPSILVLAVREREYTPPILLAAAFAGLLQPDAALGFALLFAAIGLHDVPRDWRIGTTCIFTFFAAIVMAVRGNPPPQEFVERVLVTAAGLSPFAALGLFLSLVVSFFLILRAIPASKAIRFTLAGCLFGFTILSLMSNYPSVLIGFGAAPILGFGLALGLATGHQNEAAEPEKDETATA